MFYQVDAFSSQAFFGNPTAIILDKKDEYSTEIRESIAREMNLSVTAFVSDSKKADFKIEYFTPKKEVTLSGHATIAALWLLADI